MKGISLRNPKTPEYCELEDFILDKENWAKIEVKAVGLCGSDIQKIFSDKHPSSYLKTSILGHEFSGQITDIKSTNKKNKIGDRVTAIPLIPCYSCEPCKNGQKQLCKNLKYIGKDLPGAFAEYVSVPVTNIRKIPENLNYETAALTDVAAVAVHCYHLADSPKNKDILVYGDGTVALSCLQLFHIKGNKVTLIGKHKKNLETAESMGAYIVDYLVTKKILYDSYDYVIEAVGRRQDQTILESINLVKPKGNIIVCGVFDEGHKGAFPFRDLFYKEAKLIGSNSYGEWNNINEFDCALKMLEDGNIDYSPIITHILPLKDFTYGINLINNKDKSGVIKIIYKP